MKFGKEVSSLVGQIPRGMISTYGEIARAMGDVVASKTVYRILRDEVDGNVPVHRVVTAKGEATYSRYLQILMEEGIPVRNTKVSEVKEHVFTDFRSNRILEKLRKEQEKLAKMVVLEDDFEKAENIGGIDVSYDIDKAYAACVVMNVDGMQVIEERRLSGKVNFPYVSTYLTYRELPMVKKVFGRLKTKPDILMIDGNGILHPRRIGIASHAGIELDIPTIGVAKSLLLGKLGKTPEKIGDFASIIHNEAVLGMALKTSKSDNYIFLSPGHRISMKSSLDLCKKLCFHRFPETIRRAHRMANELRKERSV